MYRLLLSCGLARPASVLVGSVLLLSCKVGPTVDGSDAISADDAGSDTDLAADSGDTHHAADTDAGDTDDSGLGCGPLVVVPDIYWIHDGETCWRDGNAEPIRLCADFWEGYPLPDAGDTAANCYFQKLLVPTVDGRCILLPTLCGDLRWLDDPTIASCQDHPECCTDFLNEMPVC